MVRNLKNQLINKYDYLIFDQYNLPLEALASFRMLFAAFSLFVIGYPNVFWLNQVPDYFYRPQVLNVAQFLSTGMPPSWILYLLSLVPALLLVLIFFGYKTKWAAISFALLLIVGAAFESSLGKIDHGIIHPLTAFIMAFSGWENKYALDSTKKSGQKEFLGLAPFLLALSVSFAFFTAGIAKVSGGWLSPDKLGVLHHFFSSFEVWDRRSFLAPLFYTVESYYFWKIQDYLTVAFECLFLLSVFWKKAFQTFIILAVVFHTGVFLIFNITITSIFLAYAVFLPWKTIVKSFQITLASRRLRPLMHFKYFLFSLITISLFFGVFIFYNQRNISLAFLNLILSNTSLDYRILQTIIIYLISWTVIVILFKKIIKGKLSKKRYKP